MIRRAKEKDTEKILKLLGEVLEIHAALRPDIFIPGTTKYTGEQLVKIFQNDSTPVFVAVDENDDVYGYAFCIFKEEPFSTNMNPLKTLYIDDICVDRAARGRHIGKNLYEYVLKFAKDNGCYNVTLNVWHGNDSAKEFYKKMGMRVKKTEMEAIL